MPHITPEVLMTLLTTAGAGKVFIEVADSMPEPDYAAPFTWKGSANYLLKWAYALTQKLASNGAKAEATRTGGKVSIQQSSNN